MGTNRKEAPIPRTPRGWLLQRVNPLKEEEEEE
jgi:hypothetical protein